MTLELQISELLYRHRFAIERDPFIANIKYRITEIPYKELMAYIEKVNTKARIKYSPTEDDDKFCFVVSDDELDTTKIEITIWSKKVSIVTTKEIIEI